MQWLDSWRKRDWVSKLGSEKERPSHYNGEREWSATGISKEIRIAGDGQSEGNSREGLLSIVQPHGPGSWEPHSENSFQHPDFRHLARTKSNQSIAAALYPSVWICVSPPQPPGKSKRMLSQKGSSINRKTLPLAECRAIWESALRHSNKTRQISGVIKPNKNIMK